MHVSETELIDFLIGTGLASKKVLIEAQAEAEKLNLGFDRVIITRGILNDRDLRRAKSYLLGVPFVDLSGERIDFKTLSYVPEPVSREHNAVAYRRTGDTLEVAFLDLATLPEVKFIERAHGVVISPRLTDPESLKTALLVYRDGLRNEFGQTIETEARGLPEMKKDPAALTDSELKAHAEDARTARILGAVLTHALLSKATNIHIEPTDSSLRVRYRLGGVMHDAAILPKHIAPRIALRAKQVAGLNLRDKLPQDGKFTVETNGGRATMRIHTSPIAHGEKLMFRVLSESASGFTLESLGMRGRALEALEKALHAEEGLILACAPAASGKSTFLYTALDILNQPDKTIHTVEDPIEYAMARVQQSQVDRAAGFDFPRALRAAATQDADILMSSDLGDAESAKIAAAAALSGELVLAGVKAESAAEGINALIDLGVDKRLLSSALSASVGMRVVKKLGPGREKYYLTKDELRSLGHLVPLEKLLETMKEEGVVATDSTWDKVPFWKPKPGQWEKLKYQGHIGLYEVATMTPRLRELVANGASRTSITEEARMSGQLSLLEDGVMKAVQGLTTIEEVLRAITL